MREYRSSNPFMQRNVFSRMESTSNEVMTSNGTVNKASILILIVFATSLMGWNLASSGGYGITVLGAIVGFVLAIVTMFKPNIANITAPIYAVAEGLFLGGITYMFELSYPGIASKAVIGTVSVFFIMMFLYRTGMIKVTDKMRSVIMGLTFGVMLAYFISFILSFFTGNSFLYSGGTLSIVFSLFVIGVAAFNLLLDFDTIERSEHAGYDKKMEWFLAFSMLITLIWLYIEMLRFLSLIRSGE